MATFTEYMNKSLQVRESINKRYNLDLETKVNCINMLNSIDKRSEKSPDIRNRFLDWMKGKTKTLALRDICKEVGYDYWKDLKTSNTIDCFDSRFN